LIKIRLQRKGRKKRPVYHIVVADSRSPRDGRIIEQIGRYDNVSENKEVVINEDRVMYWLDSGAQPSDTVRKILRRQGLLYKRHLIKWGKSEEEIEAALSEWAEYRASKEEEKVSIKEQQKAVLAAEEKEFKEQLQQKAAEAAEDMDSESEETAAEEAVDEVVAEEAVDEVVDEETAEETSEAADSEEVVDEDKTDPAEAQEEVAEVSEEDTTAEQEETKDDDLSDEAETEDETQAEEDDSDEAEEEVKTDSAEEEEEEPQAEEETAPEPAQLSTDMTAKEAIDHIKDTPVDKLDGFVPDDEDRVTVQRAWESKQEEE